MGVDYIQNVSDVISKLRSSEYCTQGFQDNLTSALQKNINASECTFTPDPLGGWNVNVTFDNKDTNVDSTTCLKKVIDSLKESISPNTLSHNNIDSNVAYVLPTGSNSLVIKI